ncbi:MAG: ATP-binding protein [Candidatus Omnitrophica bacterium]|nr:ATP-binding protein [Candidatus Omnitrophota bacterium]MDD5670609.1 ATP-binding protein [Candidatus Omnitrophota bacterium]
MISKLKIGTRLIIGYVAIASLTGIVSIISYQQFNLLHLPLKQEIPAGLKEIERTSYLDSLAQKIQYDDQILTEAVRSYARTGTRKWKYRYFDIEPKLAKTIQEAISKGDDEDKKIFSELFTAKKMFGDIEKQSIKAMDEGTQTKALELIEGIVYWQLKEEYKDKLKIYAERRGKQYGESLVVTSGKVDSIVNETHNLVLKSVRLLGIASVLAVIFAVIMGFAVSRSISDPIKMLQEGAQVIGRGNLNYRIDVKAQDEVGQLASAFNEMAFKLQESYLGLEDKVREKTKDLAAALEKIEQEKVQYEALLASIGDGMIAIDQDGNVMMINKPAEEMLGCKMSEVVGQPFDKVISSQDEKGEEIPYVKRPVTLALATGRRITSVAYYVRKHGERFPVATNVSPIILGDRAIGAIEIFRDITREKEIDQMKSEFISTVSHELRTPLTVIREGVSLVLDGVLGKTTEDQQKFLNLSLADIDRLKRIIDNLLDVSKIEAGKVGLKRELVDLVELAHHVIETFQSRAKMAGLELRLKVLNEGIAPLYLDRDRMIQVFTNLIGNAFKFTEKGYVEIQIEDKGEQIECAVADSGRGISQEDLPKLFNKFQQVGRGYGGEKGTGLGLSIAKGIVNLHGGRIWVESQLNVGTQFKFDLPKFSGRDVFQSHVIQSVKQAAARGTLFSVMAIGLRDPEGFKKQYGRETFDSHIAHIEEFSRSCLRQATDVVIRDANVVLLAISGVGKAEVVRVAERIDKLFADYLSKIVFAGTCMLLYGIASYPEDGDNGENLIQGALRRLSESRGQP